MAEYRQALFSRLATAAIGLLVVVVVSVGGYYVIGGARWSLAECLYMTVVTLSTVGFEETLPGLKETPLGRIWTMGLIVLGSGTVIYFVSTLTAWIVESDLAGVLRRKRMQKNIDSLADHIIVCGAGATGVHVIRELVAAATPFLIVDHDLTRIARVAEELETELLYIEGDATDDQAMQQAGIARARGVVAALSSDKDNLYVAVTARALNSRLRIVAKGVEPSAVAKLKRAGANAVVSPSLIGGQRLASEMIRPSVVRFLDVMLRRREGNLRIEELVVGELSPLVGKQLKEADLRSYADILIVAARSEQGVYTYNPGPDFALSANMTLIVLTQTSEMQRLQSQLSGES